MVKLGGNKDTLLFVGGALVVGFIASKVLASQKVGAVKAAASDKMQKIANAYPATAGAVAAQMGMGPTMSRAFPDRSNLFNSIPSPMVEHNVPFDSSGRYAKVQGIYDKCDARLFN